MFEITSPRKGKELKENLGPPRPKGPAMSSSLFMTLLRFTAEDGFVGETENLPHI